MFTVMPTPIFSFGLGLGASASPTFYRPDVPSPLSSSPIRASSVSPPPALTPRDLNTLPPLRETQSSPITAKQQQQQMPPQPQSASRFKYASRNPRPNPVVKRREDAQESRRRLFLQNVRQRAEDEKWEKRGGENELLKLEWWRLNRELRNAKESDIEGFVRDEEIEDEASLQPPSDPFRPDPTVDLDSMMLDAIEQEEAEIDALVSSLPTGATGTETPSRDRSDSQLFSDDEDYDALFAEFLSSELEDRFTQDVEMS